jgi:hypothetical protein
VDKIGQRPKQANVAACFKLRDRLSYPITSMSDSQDRKDRDLVENDVNEHVVDRETTRRHTIDQCPKSRWLEARNLERGMVTA